MTHSLTVQSQANSFQSANVWFGMASIITGPVVSVHTSDPLTEFQVQPAASLRFLTIQAAGLILLHYQKSRLLVS